MQTTPAPCMPPQHYACPKHHEYLPHTMHSPWHHTYPQAPCMPLWHHVCPSSTQCTTSPPPLDRRNDTGLWKHYLPTITVAGYNHYNVKGLTYRLYYSILFILANWFKNPIKLALFTIFVYFSCISDRN